MAWRNQNNAHPHGRTPSYYANHRLYPGAYAQPEAQTRTSRRVHDGFTLNNNFGLDTTSDDINSSPYSSPYYVNGRYNSDNLTTQRGNSASVQGTEYLLLPDKYCTKTDFNDADIQATIELWQGKQIKFTVFEHYELHSMTVVPALANPKKKLYVRMEIWDEVDQERSANPFNTNKKIEIASTGLGNHTACVYKLQDKNVMVQEKYEYEPFPSRPLIGLIYSDYESVPVDRIDNMKTGGTVSLNGYRYDIFCVKNASGAEMIIYDKAMNKIIPNQVKIDGRVKQLNIAQATDTDKVTWVYYVDGYSPLQRFKIGEWESKDFPSGSADNVTAQIDNETWYNSPLGSTSGTYVFTYKAGEWLYNDVKQRIYGIITSRNDL